MSQEAFDNVNDNEISESNSGSISNNSSNGNNSQKSDSETNSQNSQSEPQKQTRRISASGGPETSTFAAATISRTAGSSRNRIRTSSDGDDSSAIAQSATAISPEDKRERRNLLRKKFDQFLAESKQTDNNARYQEALTRLKAEKEADGFNLICRTKGDQYTGLIILNRNSSKRTSSVSEAPALPAAPPQPKIRRKTQPTEAMDNEEEIEEPPTKSQRAHKEPAIKVSVRQAKRTATVSPKSTARQPASEALIKGLSNKVDALWRQLDHMKTKKEQKKIQKLAEATMKDMLNEEYQKTKPKTDKELLYERIERSGSFDSGSTRVNPKVIFKTLY